VFRVPPAKLFPNVHVKLCEAIGWSEIKDLLQRGDIHLGQNLANATQLEDQSFESQRLEPVELRTRSQRMCWLIFRPVRSPISGAEILFCCMMAVEIASKQFWHYRRLSRERVLAVSSLFLFISC